MRGLDKDERYVLDVIARQDYLAPMSSREAVTRVAARTLFRIVVDRCAYCDSVHEMPTLTPEGKTAIWCDDAAKKTLEL